MVDKKSVSSHCFIPAQYIEVFDSVLMDHGVDTQGIYKKIGLHGLDLNDPNSCISIEQFKMLMQITIENLNSFEPYSIQLLRSMPVSINGIAGMAAMTSETLSDALDIGIRYIPLVAPSFKLFREDIANQTIVHVQNTCSIGSPMDEIIEEVIVGNFCKMAQFTDIPSLKRKGSLNTGMRVQFRHSYQGDIQAFHDFFGKLVKFGCAETQFIVSKNVLKSPLTTKCKATHSSLKVMLEQRLVSMDSQHQISPKIRAFLRSNIMKGIFPDANSVAQEMCISKRTLSRRLADEGYSFNSLVEEIRIERAESLILGTDISIAEIATIVGYSESSTLSRVFKRVKKISPSELRGK